MKGKVAFITGASGGIGGATAKALSREGATVVLFGGRNAEKLKKKAEEIGGLAVPCDITDDRALIESLRFAVERTGGMDVLINNAGEAFNASVENTPVEVFDRLMRLNVRAPFVLTQAALPYLKKSKAASIINIASVTAHSGYPDQSAYSASKHALLGFTKSLAAEVYKEGIRVHAVSCGGVYTDMIKIARPDLSPDGMTLPEEVADVILFLLKNRGNAVIDEIIVHRMNKPPFLV